MGGSGNAAVVARQARQVASVDILYDMIWNVSQ